MNFVGYKDVDVYDENGSVAYQQVEMVFEEDNNGDGQGNEERDEREAQ